MQISRISVVTLFLATFSLATSVENPVARDISVADVAGEVQKREFLEARAKKVKGSSGGGDDEEDSAVSSHRLNIALAAGAGVIAVGAMMV